MPRKPKPRPQTLEESKNTAKQKLRRKLDQRKMDRMIRMEKQREDYQKGRLI